MLTGIALILSGIRAWSYYKRNHNGTLSIAVLLWFLIYAMGAVGTVISSVCIGACVYLFVFYKGQTVPYVLLPDDDSEKKIQMYITIAFSFKVSETTVKISYLYSRFQRNLYIARCIFFTLRLDRRNDRIRLSVLELERIFHRLGTTKNGERSRQVRLATHLLTETIL